MQLAVFMKFVRLRIKERMEYRGAYILGVFAQMLGYGGNFLVVWLFLHRFQTIHGWAWPEVAFLYSLELFTYALGASFTFSPMIEIEKLVTDGTFDGVLVKPANPYMYMMARMYNVGYAAHVLLAAGVLIWSLTRLQIDWTWFHVVYFMVVVCSAVLLQAAALTALGGVAFQLIRSRFIFSLYFRLKSFISYPISIYGFAIQVALTVIFPLAFINFYPASLLLSKHGMLFPGWVGWLAPVAGPLCFLAAYKAWNAGINRYQGAGG